MNNSYITIIKEKRTVLSRKRVPLNQNECTADFVIGVPFEQNLQRAKYNILADDIPMKYFIDSFNVCLDMYGILSFDPVYFPSVSELMASIKISGYGESDDEYERKRCK